MDFWILLWKVTLVAGLTAFAALSVWVTIFGARDIKHLLKTLNEEAAQKGK